MVLSKQNLIKAEKLFPTFKTMNKHQLEIMLLEIRNMDWARIGNGMVLKHDYINYLLNTEIIDEPEEVESLV